MSLSESLKHAGLVRCRAWLTVVFVGSLTVVAVRAQTARGTGSESYDSFMKESLEQREARFRGLSPEAKAALKRTHTERWLKEHRRELTSSQIALVEEGIAFITPALYQHPEDAVKRKQEEDLISRLTCSLGQQRVTAAFTFLPVPAKQTWRGAVDEWLVWFHECLIK